MNDDELFAWQLQNEELIAANIQLWDSNGNRILQDIMNTNTHDHDQHKDDDDTLQMRSLKEQQDREYEESLKKDRHILFEKRFLKIPPPHFICQHTGKVMKIPIIDLDDGLSYEKHAILDYLKKHDNRNIYGKYIDRTKLIINNNLKNEIGLWFREHA